MPTFWYDLSTPENRSAAIEEVTHLRGDTHVWRVHAAGLVHAIREGHSTGTIEVEFVPGENAVADPTLLRHGRNLPQLLAISDVEYIRQRIQRGLGLPDTQVLNDIGERLRRETIERFMVAAPTHRSRFDPIGINPIRRNIDYQGAARRTFFENDFLEERLNSGQSLSDHITPPTVPEPTWPDWCVVGATVYDGHYSPFKVTKVGVRVELLSTEGVGSVYVVLVCKTPDDLARFTRELPKTRWERLNED